MAGSGLVSPLYVCVYICVYHISLSKYTYIYHCICVIVYSMSSSGTSISAAHLSRVTHGRQGVDFVACSHASRDVVNDKKCSLSMWRAQLCMWSIACDPNVANCMWPSTCGQLHVRCKSANDTRLAYSQKYWHGQRGYVGKMKFCKGCSEQEQSQSHKRRTVTRTHGKCRNIYACTSIAPMVVLCFTASKRQQRKECL